MTSTPRRLQSATGTVALVVALLALLASAAGVGYAAGTIGASDLKKNAVTTPKIKKNAVTGQKIKKNAVTGAKIKNGSVSPADLAPLEKQRLAVLANGTEGDCKWTDATSEVPGTGAPTFRKDRDGRVFLSGIAVSDDTALGDASCDSGDAGQVSDGIAFTLPAGYVPAKTQYLANLGGLALVVGPQGFTDSGTTLPPGTVFAPDGVVILDGITFDAAGSNVALPKMQAAGRWAGSPL
jgi:hypothetical protein